MGNRQSVSTVAARGRTSKATAPQFHGVDVAAHPKDPQTRTWLHSTSCLPPTCGQRSIEIFQREDLYGDEYEVRTSFRLDVFHVRN